MTGISLLGGVQYCTARGRYTHRFNQLRSILQSKYNSKSIRNSKKFCFFLFWTYFYAGLKSSFVLSVTIWGQISQTIEIFVSLWLHRGEVLLHWELAGPVQFLMLRVGSIDHCLMTHYPTLLHWPTKNTKLRSFIFFYGALVMIFFLVLMYITLKSDKTGLGHSDNGSHDANHFISFDIALHIFLNRVNIKVDLQ